MKICSGLGWVYQVMNVLGYLRIWTNVHLWVYLTLCIHIILSIYYRPFVVQLVLILLTAY